MKKILSFVLATVLLCTTSAFAMSTYEFDAGMAKGINYYNRGLYYEARDEFQWFCDANWGNMNPGQQQYALDYLGNAKAKIGGLSKSVQALSTAEFDAGMAKGINYYNRGMYYEARDEFQWFCDANWGRMNSGQQQYALDYLGNAKAKISGIQTTAKAAAGTAKNVSAAKGFHVGDAVIQNFIILTKYGTVTAVDTSAGKVKVKWYRIEDSYGNPQKGFTGAIYGLNGEDWYNASEVFHQ